MAAEKKTLKMVSGSRYTCPAAGDDVLTPGDKITVDAKIAQFLLDDFWMDIAGNEHPYFEEVDAGDDGDPDDDTPAADQTSEATDTAVAAKQVTRTRTTKK